MEKCRLLHEHTTTSLLFFLAFTSYFQLHNLNTTKIRNHPKRLLKFSFYFLSTENRIQYFFLACWISFSNSKFWLVR
ncbi:hypothetical protein Lalb_Chr24g0403591 [Lupinus albus]|uniref:Uncharacterized protein n=1 Tax=Lupinus albus TaxID=3870 RepID=A0A6A4ND47_LUPAL|nr:hypothetical protein Lalb_Chr24g0403591 [Lupinus albus]